MQIELSVAIGRSRDTKKWANTKFTWDAFVNRFRNTTRTPETYKEYCVSAKAKQSDIKDRGGFVGGYLKDGLRNPKSVVFRQLVTLDLDMAHLDFWDDFKAFYGNAAVIHSTHKHSEESPRYRLIMPLDRTVTAEEYEAIVRKLSETLDINLFDPTTFQPERLMYWPTTSVDAVYFFREQKGPELCASDVLAQYVDWHDISEWPKPDSETTDIFKSLKQQGEPTEKPGLIGAFNRAYTITEAIEEFLSDIYEATDRDDRFTYSGGQGAAGGIVYDDKFFYSHHSSDPIHGITCNAFDLVRLHKFGHEDTKAEQDITKRKSYILMNSFAAGIDIVVKQIAMAKLPQDDFDDLYDNTWYGKLTVNKTGNYENTINNAHLIISNDIHLQGRLMYDLFNLREIIKKPVPWDNEVTGFFEFTDNDAAALRHYIENKYGVYHAIKVKDALAIVFNQHTFHPITDYIDGLQWDGERRLDTILIDYLGAEDSDLNRLICRKSLVAAVARVYQPGIKFDYVLTLVGQEGVKKSTLFDKLAGKWFSDSFLGVEGTRAFEQLQGSWIIELAELSAIRRSDAEATKHFITKREDKFRVAYGSRNQTFPRQCIFVGTTNKFGFLKDNDGNRRFWAVVVNDYGEKDVDDIPQVKDQIWAEAKAYYDAGEKLYLDPLIEEEAREMQNLHTEIDERRGLLHEFLKMLLPIDWDDMDIADRRDYLHGKSDLHKNGEFKRVSVCAAEIWCELFRSEFKDMTTQNTKFIHDILNNMPGWGRHKGNLTFPIYGKQRAYSSGEEISAYNVRKSKRKSS